MKTEFKKVFALLSFFVSIATYILLVGYYRDSTVSTGLVNFIPDYIKLASIILFGGVVLSTARVVKAINTSRP